MTTTGDKSWPLWVSLAQRHVSYFSDLRDVRPGVYITLLDGEVIERIAVKSEERYDGS